MPKAANGQKLKKKKKAGLFSLYLSDGTHSFGAAFPEDQPLVYMQVLRGFDEAKVHRGFVPRPQAVLVHAEDRGRLTDAAAMHCGWNAQRLSAAGAVSRMSFRQTSKAALATLQLMVQCLKCKNRLHEPQTAWIRLCLVLQKEIHTSYTSYLQMETFPGVPLPESYTLRG